MSAGRPSVGLSGEDGRALPDPGRSSSAPRLSGLLRSIAAGQLGLDLGDAVVREWELAGASYALGVRGDRAVVLVGPKGRPSIGAALVALGAGRLARLDVVVMGGAVPSDAEVRAYRLEIALWRARSAGGLVEVGGEELVPWVEPPPLPGELGVVAASLGVVCLEGDGRWSLGWRGLEVGEVRRGESGAVLVELGVGRHDRRARAELAEGCGPAPVAAELAAVVGVVERWRRPSVPAHPANQLGLGGWLGDAVHARPAAAGLAGAELVALDPDLRARRAFGVVALGDGSVVPAVFVVGLDPSALDASEVLWSRIRRSDPDPGRLALVHPAGDPRSAWSAVVRHARRQVVEVEVGPDWRSWALVEGR